MPCTAAWLLNKWDDETALRPDIQNLGARPFFITYFSKYTFQLCVALLTSCQNTAFLCSRQLKVKYYAAAGRTGVSVL